MTGRLRIVAMIVAVVIVIGAVTGIAFATANYEPAEAATGLTIDGAKVEDASPMLTLGDNEISFDEYRYYYLSTRAYFESMLGEEVWENDIDHAYELALRDNVLTSLQQSYAWLAIAEEMGVELDEEEHQSVADDVAAKKEEHGSDFETWLHSMYYTDEDMYIRVAETTALTGKAQEQYREEVTAEMDDETSFEGYASAKHILIMPDAEATDAALALDEALAQAEDILQQIRSSDDPEATFDTLMHEYSEDTGLENYPDGYTFGAGEIVDEFYDTAISLEVGEISEPVESTYGFHIVLRLPLDEVYIEENKESLLSNQVSAKVTERQQEVIDDMPVTEGKYYTQVRPTNMA